MVKEKVWCSYAGERSQRRRPLAESRVNLTLSQAMGGQEERRGESQETRRLVFQNGWII